MLNASQKEDLEESSGLNIPPYLNLGYKYWESHYSDLVETYIRDRNIPDDLAVVIRKENLPARIAKGEIMTSVQFALDQIVDSPLETSDETPSNPKE